MKCEWLLWEHVNVQVEALHGGMVGRVTSKLQWSLTTSYVDHGHDVVKQFPENNEMSSSSVG